jgi:hypothetical protein
VSNWIPEALSQLGFVINLVGILTALFGLALAGYLVYVELRL